MFADVIPTAAAAAALATPGAFSPNMGSGAAGFALGGTFGPVVDVQSSNATRKAAIPKDPWGNWLAGEARTSTGFGQKRPDSGLASFAAPGFAPIPSLGGLSTLNGRRDVLGYQQQQDRVPPGRYDLHEPFARTSPKNMAF